MSKTVKAYLCGTAVIVLSLISVACPKKKITTVPTQTQVTDTVPPVAIKVDTAPKTETVEKNKEFVDEKPVKVEILPTDLTSATDIAHQRGYLQDAFYNFDESTISPEAQAALTASANWLRQHPEYSLLIEGHCDERGTEQYNLALGDRRANSARDFLATLGLEGSRMRTVSYGEEKPFDQGHDESAWAKNRRAHLVLVR